MSPQAIFEAIKHLLVERAPALLAGAPLVAHYITRAVLAALRVSHDLQTSVEIAIPGLPPLRVDAQGRLTWDGAPGVELVDLEVRAGSAVLLDTNPDVDSYGAGGGGDAPDEPPAPSSLGLPWGGGGGSPDEPVNVHGLLGKTGKGKGKGKGKG